MTTIENEAKKILIDLQKSNSFSASLTFEDYIEGLCKRYARIYGEILNQTDYPTIVNKLKEKDEM